VSGSTVLTIVVLDYQAFQENTVVFESFTGTVHADTDL